MGKRQGFLETTKLATKRGDSLLSARGKFKRFREMNHPCPTVSKDSIRVNHDAALALLSFRGALTDTNDSNKISTTRKECNSPDTSKTPTSLPTMVSFLEQEDASAITDDENTSQEDSQSCRRNWTVARARSFKKSVLARAEDRSEREKQEVQRVSSRPRPSTLTFRPTMLPSGRPLRAPPSLAIHSIGNQIQPLNLTLHTRTR